VLNQLTSLDIALEEEVALVGVNDKFGFHPKASQRVPVFIRPCYRYLRITVTTHDQTASWSTDGLASTSTESNLERFPPDFMFELSAAEWTSLRSQFVTSTPGRGGRRYAPYAFAEQGVAMLSSVLNSDRAIAVNIEIMRSFVRIRRLLEADKSVARKFERLERRLASHDQAIVGILAAIHQLMHPRVPKRRGIGFTADLSE
jgi:ORF6N domain